MPFLIYTIPFRNFELQDLYIQIQNLDTLEDPPGDTGGGTLQGSENVCIVESIDNDDDKTKAVKARRMVFGFNSNDEFDVATFSDGSDTTFFTALKRAFSDSFHGFISLDDVSEAFQPRPNPVTLISSDGLGFLKNQELKTVDDELPLGKFTIMEFIVMCLRKTGLNNTINVVMNLFEEDTDPLTEHSWTKVSLDALTFEKDIDEREDCYTTLQKILDAFGCFVTWDYEGWWIVRWDEYDAIAADRIMLRVARFGEDGSFIQYEDVVFDKVIAADYDPEHEGYFLSQDSAQRRFQRKAKEVKLIYKFETPKELICNIDFTRGDVVDDTIPLRTFEIDCWELRRGFGSGATTPTIEANIWRRYDANEYEDERYVVLTPPPSNAAPINYIRSQGVPIHEKDKFDFGFDYSADQDNATDGPATISIAALILEGDDGSYWVLGDNISALGDEQEPEWKLTNADFNVNADVYQWFFGPDSGDEDYREFRNYSISAPPAPTTGDLYVHFFSANQHASNIDDFAIRYNNLTFEYFPYIDGTYKKLVSQQYKVSQDTDSRVIEKQIYISDSPKEIFKGAMLKEQESPEAWVLTANWDDFSSPTAVGPERLGKHLVFAWWNQFRKTRTVIDTDIQGIRTDLQGGVPALIHRYEIKHGDEGLKYFTLNSYAMDFRTCGWKGVFIENSSGDGDRAYTDPFEFKYLTE